MIGAECVYPRRGLFGGRHSVSRPRTYGATVLGSYTAQIFSYNSLYLSCSS